MSFLIPRPAFFAFLSFALAIAASGQCYQFSAPGANMAVDITSFNQIGPTNTPGGGFFTVYTFSSTVTLTRGGSSQSFPSAAGNGTIMYSAPVGQDPALTNMHFGGGSTDGTIQWGFQLTGNLNLIPGMVLPRSLPSISQWTLQGAPDPFSGDTISIQINGSLNTYEISAISSCNQINGKTLGDPNWFVGGCGCGEPINLATGNVYYTITDYATAGANPLPFTRSYNSLAGSNTFAAALGPNWRSNFDRYLRISSSTVIAERPDGAQITFALSSGAWRADTDVDFSLTNSGATWTLTDPHDTVETYSAVSSGEGQLQSIAARSGYTQTLHYGAAGQINSVSDSYGRTLTFAYLTGLLHTVSTPDALVITFGYTAGQLTSVSYSTTPATMQTYRYQSSASANALTGIVDENGNTYLSWTYDSSGRALTSQHAGGADQVTIVYNDTDGSRMVTNPLGLHETYKFTTLQGVPKVTEIDRAAGSTTAAAKSTYTYDSNGYTSSHTDWNGIVTNYVNDPHGQVVRMTEAAGAPQARTTTVVFDSRFHLPVHVVTPGLTADFTYDGGGELLTRTLTDTTANAAPYSTNGQTRTWTYTWSNFLETSVQSPRTDLASVTKFSFDSTGALASITNALNQTITVTSHLAGGLPTAWTDENGVSHTETYDARQRRLTLAVVTVSGPLTTSFTYDAAGNLLRTTLPDGSALTNSYDQAHRLTGITDLANDKVAYGLDAMGDVTSAAISNPGGAATRQRSATYDALGRFSQESDGAGQVTSLSYDLDGNPLSLTDPLQHGSQQSFDSLNRLTRLTNAAQGVIGLTYDARNHPASLTDPSGAITTFTYDGFEDRIQQSSPVSGTAIYAYDSAGDLISSTDARGSTVRYSYDAMGRVLTVKYLADDAEDVTYTYDQTGAAFGFGVGHPTTVVDAAGTLTRSYDERGNLISETRARTGGASAVTLKTSYTYDNADRVASIAYPSGALLSYTRDNVGRITGASIKPAGASQAATVVSNLVHEPFGPIASFTFGNGVTDQRSFDLAYRVKDLRDSGSSPILGASYSYDPDDDATLISDLVASSNGQTLGYDSLNRLTSAAGNYGTLSYSYDANGNRTSDAGSTSDGLGSVTTFVYNQAGRLSGVNSGAQQLVAYTYDAFGRRVEKIAGPTAVTLFDYDARGHLLEEADAQGNLLADYIYVGGRVVATLAPAGNLYFLHTDRLGTPQAATDSSQKVVWRASYQPFGGINPSASQISTLAQDLRLPGQEAEQETGLYHNGFRDYAPFLGRYVESDPIGLGGGSNLYAYAGNNPANLIDPLGLCTLTDVQVDGTRARLYFSNDEVYSVADWTTMTEAQQLALIYQVEQTPDDDGENFSHRGSVLTEFFDYISSLIGKNPQPAPVETPTGAIGIRG